jgi:oligo-1,6-glucosidase
MLATLLFSLRGTPFIFQGQEIGMTNFGFTSMDEIRDLESHKVDRFLRELHLSDGRRMKIIRMSTRDNGRTPMQWDGSRNGGFTSGEPWIAVNNNYRTVNVQSQVDDPDSIWSYYKEMIRFRQQSEVMVYGDFREVIAAGRLFAFERVLGKEKLLIALNFGSRKIKANFPGEVVLSNVGRKSYDGTLGPYEAIILR